MLEAAKGLDSLQVWAGNKTHPGPGEENNPLLKAACSC